MIVCEGFGGKVGGWSGVCSGVDVVGVLLWV